MKLTVPCPKCCSNGSTISICQRMFLMRLKPKLNFSFEEEPFCDVVKLICLAANHNELN